jgi:hypothetical protein
MSPSNTQRDHAVKEYISAVEGDPLSSSPDSYVMPSGVDMLFVDEGNRSMAFIGGDAYCGKCKSIGKIIGGSGCSESARLYDEPTNQRQAVAGDFVQCQCATRPVILPRYGTGWKIEDSSSNSFWPSQFSSTSSTSSAKECFDEMFVLRDEDDHPIPNQAFRIKAADGSSYEGTSSDTGETIRIRTSNAMQLKIELVV